MSLNCPLCFPDYEDTLALLPSSHADYYISQLLNDGTKKWYLCKECDGAFCYDKMTGAWQISPSTYDKFIELGILKDVLES